MKINTLIIHVCTLCRTVPTKATLMTLDGVSRSIQFSMHTPAEIRAWLDAIRVGVNHLFAEQACDGETGTGVRVRNTYELISRRAGCKTIHHSLTSDG